MNRYRAGTIERVAAAQAIQNRVNGVAAVLPNNYDGFVTDYLAVPYA